IVRRELVVAGDQVAERFDQVSGTQWSRTGRRSDGATFTVETFGKYFLHDPIHHLWDVSRSF
ncbi:MAG: DinB family protein, partial [Actinomycetota bacterium]